MLAMRYGSFLRTNLGLGRYGLSPEGARLDSPGRNPGRRCPQAVVALKGRDNRAAGLACYAPLGLAAMMETWYPGRCPGLSGRAPSGLSTKPFSTKFTQTFANPVAHYLILAAYVKRTTTASGRCVKRTLHLVVAAVRDRKIETSGGANYWSGHGRADLGNSAPNTFLVRSLLFTLQTSRRMLRLLSKYLRAFPPGCCWAAILGACLALSGCVSLNNKDDASPDETRAMMRRMRPYGDHPAPTSFSNAGRSIENDLGCE